MTKKFILPYGDTLDDGKVQLSFSLPHPCNPLGEAAAKATAEAMNLYDVQVVYSAPLSEGFSFYVVYGMRKDPIDVSTLTVREVEHAAMSKESVEAFIAEHFDRPLVFIGATTGSDAHTVGIDAIMNMKGIHGHYGLERYQGIRAVNLGSQVDNETLLDEAKKHRADVILVSQTVTQKAIHIRNLTAFVELLEAEGERDNFIIVVGGARISHALAKELGFDAGFGPKKYAFDVASFAVKALQEKQRHNR